MPISFKTAARPMTSAPLAPPMDTGRNQVPWAGGRRVSQRELVVLSLLTCPEPKADTAA